jgi:hypothetical protein
MKRNLTLLTIVGALVAFAVPASASATVAVTPAGHSFEVGGTAPVIQGSLTGSCSITKITGTVPASPANVNESLVDMKIAAPTVSCGAGVTATVGAGEWKLRALSGSYQTVLTVPANGLTLRYTSLPGCKLSNTTAFGPQGIWGNGLTATVVSRSILHFHSFIRMTWANDGATCATAGKVEDVSLAHPSSGVTPFYSVITDTTNKANVIQINAGV